jgi:hypothetical protein
VLNFVGEKGGKGDQQEEEEERENGCLKEI